MPATINKELNNFKANPLTKCRDHKAWSLLRLTSQTCLVGCFGGLAAYIASTFAIVILTYTITFNTYLDHMKEVVEEDKEGRKLGDLVKLLWLVVYLFEALYRLVIAAFVSLCKISIVSKQERAHVEGIFRKLSGCNWQAIGGNLGIRGRIRGIRGKSVELLGITWTFFRNS